MRRTKQGHIMLKVAVLFPGYGSGKLLMNKEIYDNMRVVQDLFEDANNCLPLNFVKLCFSSSEVELSKLVNRWPALYVAGLSLFRCLEKESIFPTIAAADNIGFFSALGATRSLTLPDGLYILNKYASIYSDFIANNVFVCRKIEGVSVEDIKVLCERYAESDDRAYVSTYDAEKICRVVGSSQAVTRLERELESFSHVFIESNSLANELHSPLAEPCLEPLGMYLRKIDIKVPRYPILLSTRPIQTDDPKELQQELLDRVVKPIRWDRTLWALRSYNVVIFLGYQSEAVTSFAEKFSSVHSFVLNTFADLEHIRSTIRSLQTVQESIDESDGAGNEPRAG